MKKYWHFAFGFFLIFAVGEAQETFTKQDTLRGSITKERAWWDVTYYHLDIKVNPADSTISGSNTIRYKVLNSYNRMQIDLQQLCQTCAKHTSSIYAQHYYFPALLNTAFKYG